ncbi:MAG: DNRLRE domain-containing protein [Akkermansiaceae bacterium]
MKSKAYIPTLLATALASAQLGSAATLALGATDNSTIRVGLGNQGTSAILFAGDTATDDDFLRTAVAFDLSNPLLTGATINSATLTFTARDADSSSANGTITLDLHQLSSSFTNDGVTWTSRNGTDNWITAGGDFGAALASTTGDPGTTAPGDTFSFSSGSLAGAAESSIGGSFYLLAKTDSENNDSTRRLFRFASSRNTTSAPGPVLTIDYTPIPEPSTALLGALGGLFLLRRRR